MAPASALLTCFEVDDADGVLAVVPGFSEVTRAATWEALRRPLSAVLEREVLSEDIWNRRILTRALLSLAIGPADVVHQVGSYVLFHPSMSDLDRVLTSRTPQWREAFTSATLRAWASETEIGLMGPTWWEWWRRLRQLERSGLLHPDRGSPDYLVVMVRGLLYSGSIVDAVREDPDLAVAEVWSLFEPTPAVQKALLGAERYWDPSNTWRVALVRLALEEVLDGQRLAAAAVAAAGNERMGRNHRAWYRRIPGLLADPQLLPNCPEHGPPPPGNQLHPRR